MKDTLTVHVLMRASKKTGEINTTITALGKAQLNMWALLNTAKNEQTFVFERESGRVVTIATGRADGTTKMEHDDLGTCEEYGIPLAELHKITDDRFDKEATE